MNVPTWACVWAPGVVWKRIYFGLGYDIGCLNLVKESDGEGTMRNNCFTISVGYNF